MRNDILRPDNELYLNDETFSLTVARVCEVVECRNVQVWVARSIKAESSLHICRSRRYLLSNEIISQDIASNLAKS
jgi:hypothetical protein